MRKWLGMIVMVGLLTACAQTAVQPVQPTLNFSQSAPFVFNARAVEVIDEYRPPLTPNHIERTMPMSPAEGINIWASQRLRANGVGDVVVRVIIENASVTETELPKKGGATGLVGVQRDKMYDGALKIRIEVGSLTTPQWGNVSAETRFSRSVLTDATLNERDQAKLEVTETLVRQMDLSLESSIPANLRRFLAQ